MAEPAAAESTTTSTPPAPPAGGAPPAAPQSPAGGKQGASSQEAPPRPSPGTPAPTPGTSQQAEGQQTEPKPIEDPHVPWRKFREVQTELTSARRQHQGELQKINGQIDELRRENQTLSSVRDDFKVLEQLIEENPDLAEQLFQRAGTTKKPEAAKPAQADPALMNEMRQLRSMIEGDRQRITQQHEQQQLQTTDAELGGVLQKLLVDNRLDEGWLPHARAYVLEVARRIPTLEMTEVPYVFAEWAKPLQQLLTKQLNAWRNGKAEDMRVLPPSPTTGGTVAGVAPHGANDNSTKRVLEERLRALGWTN